MHRATRNAAKKAGLASDSQGSVTSPTVAASSGQQNTQPPIAANSKLKSVEPTENSTSSGATTAKKNTAPTTTIATNVPKPHKIEYNLNRAFSILAGCDPVVAVACTTSRSRPHFGGWDEVVALHQQMQQQQQLQQQGVVAADEEGSADDDHEEDQNDASNGGGDTALPGAGVGGGSSGGGGRDDPANDDGYFRVDGSNVRFPTHPSNSLRGVGILTENEHKTFQKYIFSTGRLRQERPDVYKLLTSRAKELREQR